MKLEISAKQSVFKNQQSFSNPFKSHIKKNCAKRAKTYKVHPMQQDLSNNRKDSGNDEKPAVSQFSHFSIGKMGEAFSAIGGQGTLTFHGDKLLTHNTEGTFVSLETDQILLREMSKKEKERDEHKILEETSETVPPVRPSTADLNIRSSTASKRPESKNELLSDRDTAQKPMFHPMEYNDVYKKLDDSTDHRDYDYDDDDDEDCCPNTRCSIM